VIDNGHEYKWTLNSQPWNQDAAMELMTAEVSFTARGRHFSVSLNTLVNQGASSGTMINVQ
jgi:hypothetical protein